MRRACSIDLLAWRAAMHVTYSVWHMIAFTACMRSCMPFIAVHAVVVLGCSYALPDVPGQASLCMLMHSLQAIAEQCYVLLCQSQAVHDMPMKCVHIRICTYVCTYAHACMHCGTLYLTRNQSKQVSNIRAYSQGLL